MVNKNANGALVPENVPLRDGPPTKEELLVHYPARFTWQQLKTFVNSGDLGLLKRDLKLQERYDRWMAEIVKKYGSVVNYLLNYRLQWGKPDTISLLTSEITEEYSPLNAATPTPYFSVNVPVDMICIIQNDWPYSVPSDVEHTVIWTKAPIYHPELMHETIKPRIDQDGLWGFTGNRSPPPSPSMLPACLPALADWGITLDKMITSPKGSEEEEALVKKAGSAVAEFVRRRWKEDVWETAWFVNPPRLQSIPHLAHIHVFARKHSN